MKLPKNVWEQLKGKTKAEFISAIEKDGFLLDEKVRTERVYRHSDGRKVTILFHHGNDTFGPGLLKALLEDVGWNVADMRRLKLIKK